MATKKESKTILEMLYEVHRMDHQMETDAIKSAFESLYASMEGMPLQTTDPIVYAACTLARAHEQDGFIDGVRIGLRLAREVDG